MKISEKLSKYPQEVSFLVKALYDLQLGNECNCLTEENIEEAAVYFNIEKSRILAIVNYYKAFSLKPKAKNVVTVCSSEICNLRNEQQIITAITEELKIALGETTSDNFFSLESKTCLGKCYDAPVVSINGEVYGELTVAGIKSIINNFRSA